MASRSKALALAQVLLSKENLPIAEEVIQKHLDIAIGSKDKARLKKLYEVVSILDEVKSET